MFRTNTFSSIKNRTYNGNFPLNREKEKKKMLMDFYSSLNNKEKNRDLLKYTDCLLEILREKQPLYAFAKWFSSLIEELEFKTENIMKYLNNIYFLKNDEDLSNDFFNYCYKLFNTEKYYNNPDFAECCKIVEYIYNFNILGSICFITPELGFCPNESKSGQIIDVLSKGLNELGQDIILISPYYHCYNSKSIPLTNLQIISQVQIQLDTNYNFDVYYAQKKGIQYYLIYHSNMFQRPHPDISGVETIREISCFCKASLQFLSNLNLIPDIIMTNSPYTGFTPAYAKLTSFKEVFKRTKFIHICSNLELQYQGRIYLPLKVGTYEYIHQLLNEIVTDPCDKRLVNPTSCAIRMSDQLAFLSRAYTSSLSKNNDVFNIYNLIKTKKDIIFLQSGISQKERQEIVMNGGDREDAKRMIQQKYFCLKIYDPNIPLYSFIGRLNEQNGALLLLESAEKLIKDSNRNINILIIGNGDIYNPYYQSCLKKINYLKKSFPYCIYAEPNRLFNDNIYLVYKGSDFGLMPFLYDNWTNLHHKYFASGTPVVAYEAGHLKDSVKEFNFSNKTGNGFLFDHFNPTEFYLAVKRTFDLYRNRALLEICRKNCEESVIDTNEVCIDFCRELYKLKNKIFFDTNKISDDFLPNKKGKNCNYNDILNLYKNSTSEKDNVYREILYDSNHFIPDYSGFGKNVKRISSCKKCSKGSKYNNFINSDLYTISYKLDYPQPKRVQITGSFDNWSTLQDLKYNRKTRKWEIDLNLRKGKYFYKFLIDNKTWKVNPFEHYQKELNGMVNNVLYII